MSTTPDVHALVRTNKLDEEENLAPCSLHEGARCCVSTGDSPTEVGCAAGNRHVVSGSHHDDASEKRWPRSKREVERG